ncbi:hypothetical protein GCM10023324_68940 [Streptomyces youssoufiensis]
MYLRSVAARDTDSEYWACGGDRACLVRMFASGADPAHRRAVATVERGGPGRFQKRPAWAPDGSARGVTGLVGELAFRGSAAAWLTAASDRC